MFLKFDPSKLFPTVSRPPCEWFKVFSETHGPSYPLMGWVILVSRLPTLALEKSHLLESLKSILFVQKLFNLEYDL